MTAVNKHDTQPRNSVATDYDAIVIGAGFGGIRMLHELRQQGLSARVFEAAGDVGGTWYWNRYPGARTDTEAWAYCYSFSKEIMDGWDWPERMPSWNQVLDYLNFVVAKLDMRKDIAFDTRIASAIYSDANNYWTITTAGGASYTCKYFISASGLLSVAYEPPFKGLHSFKGEWYMTARWPKEPVNFTGKRVAIVGAGSTAVQVLPVIAQTAGHVTLFQRTPNYVLPGRNYPLDDAQRQAIKSNYDAIWKQVRKQVFAFPIDPPNRKATDVTPEQRQRILEAGWETGGFRFVFETFDDILTNQDSNDAAAEFVRSKIRAIVKDPKTAELLCPDYPIFIKRPPLGNFYYEAFNRPNVSIVDVRNNPIEEITPNGIRTAAQEYEFDIIIYAIGFDAVTGALTSMDVRGRDGLSIKESWEDGPRTHLGIMMDNFPNMFMISGPQAPFANIPPIIEGSSTWIGNAIRFCRAHGYDRMEATPAAVQRWSDYMKELLDATLLGKGEALRTWFLGANIPGKPHRVLFYFGGAGAYFDELEQSVESSFDGFIFATDRTAVRHGQPA